MADANTINADLDALFASSPDLFGISSNLGGNMMLPSISGTGGGGAGGGTAQGGTTGAFAVGSGASAGGVPAILWLGLGVLAIGVTIWTVKRK